MARPSFNTRCPLNIHDEGTSGLQIVVFGEEWDMSNVIQVQEQIWISEQEEFNPTKTLKNHRSSFENLSEGKPFLKT